MNTQNTPLLKVKEKIAYASGDFASNLSFHVINVFLMVYLTDVFGLNAAAVGQCSLSVESLGCDK